MSDERHEGLMCPECGAYGTLRVKWTAVKSPLLRRYVFKCNNPECGAAVKAYLEIDEVVSREAQQKILDTRECKNEQLEKEHDRWCKLL